MTESIPPTSAGTPRQGLFRRLMTEPLGAAAVVVLAIIAVLVAAGPLLAPYDPNVADLGAILQSPGADHLLGTDGAGRDVLSRLLIGGVVTLLAAVFATAVAILIGLPAGLIAGYYRGPFDAFADWVVGVLMSLPAIIVLLAVRSAVGPSVWLLMAVFGVILIPAMFRLTRTAVLSVSGELYIDAAKVFGVSDRRIIARHILSVVRAPIIIQAARITGIAIAIQSGLEYLGLGDRSVPTWGQMLSEGFRNIYVAPLLLFWPTLAIGLTIVSLAVLANALRDALEDDAVQPQRVTAAERQPHADEAGDPAPEVSVDSVLSVRGLTIGYPDSGGRMKTVVNGVDLDIRRGEILGIVGESGSGKTQTAFAVLGLLPHTARTLGGQVRFNGAVLEGAAGNRGNERLAMAYVPQEPMTNLDPNYTIGYQLVRPMVAVAGYSRSAATTRALELLDEVGIRDPRRVLRARAHEISGGMAQRVLIAGAISCQPQLLIADEPTTALDVTVQAEILDLLRDLQRDLGMAMMMVTHNFGVVSDLCDRVAVMRHGSIVETGPVRDVLLRPQHEYTKALIQSTLEDKPPMQPLGAKAIPA